MKKIVFAFLFLSVFISNSQTEKYHKVEISGPTGLIPQLLKLGITIDHSEIKDNTVITEISNAEVNVLKQNGINHTILINDMATYYENRIKEEYKNKTSLAGLCNDPTVQKPSRFHLGTMGGYFTLTEMQNILDSMTLLYPTLITAKAALSPQTIQGRNIWYLKISDNPNVDESEPEVFYNALHHAREAASLSQLIFYMWYVLENYSTNPDIKFLVDNTEMYFVPCVNPDGYEYNRTTNPGGGGMWRKNRRNNGSTFGVDLNRNYGYQWGYDNVGSSPTSSSDTYRGTAAFSEPETQAIRNFCNARQFQTALNAHTYSNLLIYPWGYVPSFYTPDSATFVNWSILMCETSRFLYGTGDQTVNYVTNGDSDDWMYGEQTTKPKILAMTPEAGAASDGFWPASSRILDICKTTFNQNLNLAKLVTNFANVTDERDHFFFNSTGYIQYNIQRLGLTPGNFTVSVVPVGVGIASTGAAKVYTGMTLNQTKLDSISYTLSGGLIAGQTIKYALAIDNGFYVHRDTLTKIYGNTVTVLNDPCNTVATNWNAGGWGNSTTKFKSAPASITDSPTGNYSNNQTKTVSLKNNLDLTGAIYAHMQYWTKFSLEKNYDEVTIQGSTNGGSTWFPICAKYETAPSSFGGTTPMYDGLQELFIKEEINLNGYLGQQLMIKFVLSTDGGAVLDGFYFDDFLVRKINTLTTNVSEINIENNVLIFPNPSNGQITLKNSSETIYTVKLFNELGQEVIKTDKLEANESGKTLQLEHLQSGIYFIELSTSEGRIVKKLALNR
ncbi:MAG: immune inhibitor A [Bacteroidia bacterium]|nr:immune inhibitor A [Bacteroidia bacterium]